MKKAIYRGLLNWYQASDRPLPSWLENACRRDASLAAERSRGDALTDALCRPPKQEDVFAGSSSMADRVLRQITEEDYLAEKDAESAASSRWSGIWRQASLAAVACLLAVAGFQWWRAGVDSQILVTNEEETAPSSSLRLVVVETPIPLPSIEASKSLARLEQRLTVTNPLDQEIEYVISDAKGALDFLTNSFVPSRYRNAGKDDQA